MLLTPPFDQTPNDPGLHQGLPAGRARERRAVHARRALGGAGHRAAGRRRPRVRAVPDAQPAHARARRRRRSRPTRSSRTSWRPTSTPRRASSGAAAGPGTPARRAGCTASGSRRSSGFTKRGDTLFIEPRRAGGVAGVHHRVPPRAEPVRDRGAQRGRRGPRRGERDGRRGGCRPDGGIRLVDDGGEHAVEVRPVGSSILESS